MNNNNNSIKHAAIALIALASLPGSLNIAEAGNASRNDGMPSNRRSYRADLVDGYLLVYSATEESSDGDIQFNAHTSYVIYTVDGKFFRNIENHLSRSDELPERVSLPPGSYSIEARSTKDGYVRVPVIVKPGRPTIVDLDRFSASSRTFLPSISE